MSSNKEFVVKKCPLCGKRHTYTPDQVADIVVGLESIVSSPRIENSATPTKNVEVYLTCPVKDQTFKARVPAEFLNAKGAGKEVTMPKPEEKEEVDAEAEALSPRDKALTKFAEDFYLKSLDVLRDFSKTMISLNSGLIVAYYAVLKFLGADNVSSPKVQEVITLVGIPPILFIGSIALLVLAVLPLIGKMNLASPDSIEKSRDRAIFVKYALILAGTALFVAGIALISYVNIKLILG